VTKFKVGVLNTKASTRALEEAQAEIANLKAKKQQEVETITKFAEKAAASSKAGTSTAEEMLLKKNSHHATREKQVQLRLEELSASFGGEVQ
jgi:hypothetical protein